MNSPVEILAQIALELNTPDKSADVSHYREVSSQAHAEIATIRESIEGIESEISLEVTGKNAEERKANLAVALRKSPDWKLANESLREAIARKQNADWQVEAIEKAVKQAESRRYMLGKAATLAASHLDYQRSQNELRAAQEALKLSAR